MRRSVLRSSLLVVLAVMLLGATGTTAAAAPTDETIPPLPSPALWPLSPAPQVIRGFDPPDEPWGSGNRGLDLAAADGAPVLAVAAGTISFAGQVGGHEVVVVDHGEVRTTYTPVASGRAVGEQVGPGDRIGTVAGSHCTDTGCLHLGLVAGDTYLDPMLLFGPDTGAAEPTGPVRLLPADAVRLARERAAQRRRLGTLAPTGEHGFVLPVAGPVTSGFGLRTHPVTGARSLHDGTDIAAACGTPLVAPYPGTVVTVDEHPALGLRVVIDHGTIDGHTVRTGLNHLSAQQVRPGDQLTAGQVVGRVGSTGLSTGCHLHLMVWLDGTVADPMAWF